MLGVWQTSGNDIKIAVRERGANRGMTETKVLHGFWESVGQQGQDPKDAVCRRWGGDGVAIAAMLGME